MNLTTGTKIKLTESVYTGSWKHPRYVGDRTILGTIVKDSYGAKRGQHTFTVQVEESTGVDAPDVGKKICRKGRTLYKKAEVISYPDDHADLAKEKEVRAADAKDQKHWNWVCESRSMHAFEKLWKIPSSWWRDNPEAKEYVERHVADGMEFYLPWEPKRQYECWMCHNTFFSQSPECRCGEEAEEVR